MNRSRVEQYTKSQAHHLQRAAYVYVRQPPSECKRIWRVDADNTNGLSGEWQWAGPADDCFTNSRSGQPITITVTVAVSDLVGSA